MNPYESPTHCEELRPVDLTALWVLLVVAFWPVLFLVVFPVALIEQIRKKDDLGQFACGMFWAAVLVFDVAIGWSLLIHFVSKIFN